MKRKILVAILALILCILFGPRIVIISVTSWEYFQATEICPPPVIPMEVKPYTVITDRGRMDAGDEYVLIGDGAWYGTVTLLFSGKKGATFYGIYPVKDPIKGRIQAACRIFVPIG